ncbi:MAG: TonB-dependent receptor [Candidimonas sp.]
MTDTHAHASCMGSAANGLADRRLVPGLLVLACGLGGASNAWSQEAAATNGPVTTLPAITITSTRIQQSPIDTPASVSTIDSRSLHEGQPQVNLSESLAAVPGLQAQNRNNYAQDLQISMRGFGARSTFGIRGIRIYVDGIPATMPDGQGQISNIDIASAERVEILRGPYSSLYGNSSGGVIQVFTAPGEGPPKLGAEFSAGTAGSRRYGLHASGATPYDLGLTDYNVSASRYALDGYREHSGMRKNLGNARLGLQLSDDSSLTLIANHLDIRADDPLGLTQAEYDRDPRSATPNATLYNTRKTIEQTQLGANYEKQIDASNTLNAMFYVGQRKTIQYQAIPAAVQSRSPTHAGGVIDLKRQYGGVDMRWTSRLELAPGPLTVIGGLSYEQMNEDRLGYENFLGPASAPTALGVKGKLRRDEANTLRSLDPYIQASWRLGERWTVEGGLRYSTVRFSSRDHYVTGGNGDDSGDAQYKKLLPVAALRYALTPDLSLYASAGRGFETPTFNEISYRPGGLPGLNFDLKPATSNNYEIGAKARLGEGLLTAALFHIDTSDEIVSDTNEGGRSTFKNAGKTRRQGLELSWDGPVLMDDLRFQASYTWLDAVVRDPEAGDGKYIPGVARQSLYAALSWLPRQGWRAGIDWRYMDKLYANSANTAQAPSYVTTGLFAGYKHTYQNWELSAMARVDNVFDRRYIGSVIVNESNSRYYEPAMGRNWTVSLNAAYRF